jgi:hypothetical protein
MSNRASRPGKELCKLPSFSYIARLRLISKHRYVRVASDTLLIAAGTDIVVDAIEDFMRMHSPSASIGKNHVH